jgi:hypothetical protein
MARFYRNLGTVKIKEEWELSKIGWSLIYEEMYKDKIITK